MGFASVGTHCVIRCICFDDVIVPLDDRMIFHINITARIFFDLREDTRDKESR